MSFFQRIRYGIARFMAGRHGSDELSLAIMIGGLIISCVGGILRFGLLQLLSFAAYGYAIFFDNNYSVKRIGCQLKPFKHKKAFSKIAAIPHYLQKKGRALLNDFSSPFRTD